MADRIIVSPGDDPALPFSGAVGSGNLLFVSGTVGRDPDTGDLVQGDIYEQTLQALENIRRHCQRGGFGLENAIKATVYLVDMKAYTRMNDAFRLVFPTHPPARTCVAVRALPDSEALVEIELVVAR